MWTKEPETSSLTKSIIESAGLWESTFLLFVSGGAWEEDVTFSSFLFILVDARNQTYGVILLFQLPIPSSLTVPST